MIYDLTHHWLIQLRERRLNSQLLLLQFSFFHLLVSAWWLLVNKRWQGPWSCFAQAAAFHFLCFFIIQWLPLVSVPVSLSHDEVILMGRQLTEISQSDISGMHKQSSCVYFLFLLLSFNHLSFFPFFFPFFPFSFFSAMWTCLCIVRSRIMFLSISSVSQKMQTHIHVCMQSLSFFLALSRDI